MNIKKILLILFLCLFPNYSHAYVDPGIFALVWQSIIAFLFASLAYFRFFYIKTTNILNNFSSVFNKKPFILIFDFFLISLALIVPILEVIKKNSIYFDLSDYAYAFITLLVLFFIVLLFVYFVLFFFNKKKKYSLTLTIFVIISSYFITSLEESTAPSGEASPRTDRPQEN